MDLINSQKSDKKSQPCQFSDEDKSKIFDAILGSMKQIKNYLYSFEIESLVAYNLYKSLFKLKRGKNQRSFLQTPIQLKIYPAQKIMILYLIVNHSYLRIKLEILNYHKNPNLNDFSNFSSKAKFNFDNVSNNNSNFDNISENSEIYTLTIELYYIFQLLDVLLTENDQKNIILFVNKSCDHLGAMCASANQIYDKVSSIILKFRLLSNSAFSYELSDPYNNKKTDKNNYENFSVNSSFIEMNKSINSFKPNNKLKDINNEYYLEQKFQISPNSLKYLIVGSDVFQLYKFFSGLKPLYIDFSSAYIIISAVNNMISFYCVNMNYLSMNKGSNLSDAINRQLRLTIKNKNYGNILSKGFNSVYKIDQLSKFISSFFNTNEKSLLMKIDEKGKMILSYTIFDSNSYGDDNDDNKADINYKVEDNRLLSDEKQGNIVEMIFYPCLFDPSI